MSTQPYRPLFAVQEVVDQVATKDLAGTADMVLDVAVKQAAEVLARKVATPEYRLERARLILLRAAQSASRLIDDRTRR